MASSGPVNGLQFIYANSHWSGNYDFGYNGPGHTHNPDRPSTPNTENDTFTRCGKTYKAGEFGNFMAGFQGAIYDQTYFSHWPFPAETVVKAAGIYYHISGNTDAKNDPWDKTGRRDINRGEKDAWNFTKNGGKCGCVGNQ